MAGRGRGGLLLVLAGLAILFGTAAMVLSRGPRTREVSRVERVSEPQPRAAARSVTLPTRPPGPPAGSEGRTTLAVRVLRLPEREPVPGAEVLLQDEGGIWKAIADRNGEAVFGVEVRRPVILRARAPGLVGLPRFALPSAVDAPPEEVLLAVEGSLHGVVRSRATREPIAGARVAAVARFPGLPSWPEVPEPAPELRSPSDEAATGPDGRFTLSGLPEGFGCDLTASRAGFADGTMGGLCPDGEGKGPDLEILLDAGGRIVGTVRDRAGSPVAGVSVAVDRSAMGVPGGPPWLPKRVVMPQAYPDPHRVGVTSFRYNDFLPPGQRALTGPDGSFALEGLASGRTWFVGAFLEGFTTAGGPAKVEWPPGAPEVRCDLVLDRAGELVVDWTAADRPAPGAATVAIEELDGDRSVWSFVNFARGRRIPRLPPGRYRITVLAEGVGQGEEEVAVPGGATIEVTIPLALGQGIDGVVVGPGGAPVPHAFVDLQLPGPSQGPFPFTGRLEGRDPNETGMLLLVGGHGTDSDRMVLGAHTRLLTDAEGRFRFLGLKAGTEWGLHVLATGFASTSVEGLSVPATGVRVELAAAGAVAGRLVLPPGAAAPSVLSFYYRPGPDRDPGVGGYGDLRSRTSFGTGAFRVENLPPGPGRLVVRGEDGGPAATVAIEIPSGGTAEAGELPMGGSLRLAGTVLDAAGNPVDGARVQFLATGVWDRTETNPTGGFYIETLPEGEGTLEVRAPFPFRQLQRRTGMVVTEIATAPDIVLVRMRVEPGKDGAPLTIRLPATGVLDGVAKDAKGAPLAGFRISATPRGAVPGAMILCTFSDPNGRLGARLPAGEYHIVIHSRTPPWPPLAEADAVVPADGVVSVELRAKE